MATVAGGVATDGDTDMGNSHGRFEMAKKSRRSLGKPNLFSQDGSFAGAGANGQAAPIPAFRGAAIEPRMAGQRDG
jgi:hypothetical protein